MSLVDLTLCQIDYVKSRFVFMGEDGFRECASTVDWTGTDYQQFQVDWIKEKYPNGLGYKAL